MMQGGGLLRVTFVEDAGPSRRRQLFGRPLLVVFGQRQMKSERSAPPAATRVNRQFTAVILSDGAGDRETEPKASVLR